MVFDQVLAYTLGETGETERAYVASMLTTGNPVYLETHTRVQQMLGQLPSVLPPVAPPPFLKDRVMAQIGAPAQVAQPASKFVNSFSLAKRTAVVAGLLVGGVFVGAYTVQQLSDANVFGTKNASSEQPIVRSSRELQNALHAMSDVRLTEAAPIQAPAAVLAEEPASSDRTDQAAEPNDGTSGHMQTNFGLTQAYINLMSEPGAMKFQLTPMSTGTAGEARVMWDENHGDALLVVSKLQPTTANSHYVLWYTHDGGSEERMMTFNAASQASMSFFVNRAPGARVSGVRITLERTAGGRFESQEVLRATAKQHVRS